MGFMSTSSLEGRGVASAQNDVELITERPLRLGRGQIEAGDQSLPGSLVRDGLKDWIEGKERVAGKIHLRDQARREGRTKDREVNVSRPPRVVMVFPGISSRFDSYKAIEPVLVGCGSAGASEVGVEGGRVIVAIMPVPAGSIRLPEFYESPRNRTAVVVEHPAGDDDPLSQRLPRMLAGEVVLALRDIAVAIHRAGDFRESVRQENQRLARRAPHGGKVRLVQRRWLA